MHFGQSQSRERGRAVRRFRIGSWIPVHRKPAMPLIANFVQSVILESKTRQYLRATLYGIPDFFAAVILRLKDRRVLDSHARMRLVNPM